jgi:hypothetical protein
MKEFIGNMWDIIADAYCITTNNDIKINGKAVMGAGVALEAKNMFKNCDAYLAEFIKKNGHIVGAFYTSTTFIPDKKLGVDLISFPTKYHWKYPSDIKLIEKSAKELMQLITKETYETVVLPRPGCNNGKLNWESVKRVISPILDDSVIVVSL